jgi:hypothetical protein
VIFLEVNADRDVLVMDGWMARRRCLVRLDGQDVSNLWHQTCLTTYQLEYNSKDWREWYCGSTTSWDLKKIPGRKIPYLQKLKDSNPNPRLARITAESANIRSRWNKIVEIAQEHSGRWHVACMSYSPMWRGILKRERPKVFTRKGLFYFGACCTD